MREDRAKISATDTVELNLFLSKILSQTNLFRPVSQVPPIRIIFIVNTWRIRSMSVRRVLGLLGVLDPLQFRQ